MKLIAIVILVLIIGGGVYYYLQPRQHALSEEGAVSLLKKAHPEYAAYPNDKLPPQSIRTEKDVDGWYVAFLQEGSGRPLISADCYYVGNDKTTRSIGKFTPQGVESQFSLKTCN